VKIKISKFKYVLSRAQKSSVPLKVSKDIEEFPAGVMGIEVAEFWSELTEDESQKMYVEDLAWSMKGGDFKLDPPRLLPKFKSEEGNSVFI
jgi:hypothetical protein